MKKICLIIFLLTFVIQSESKSDLSSKITKCPDWPEELGVGMGMEAMFNSCYVMKELWSKDDTIKIFGYSKNNNNPNGYEYFWGHIKKKLADKHDTFLFSGKAMQRNGSTCEIKIHRPHARGNLILKKYNYKLEFETQCADFSKKLTKVSYDNDKDIFVVDGQNIFISDDAGKLRNYVEKRLGEVLDTREKIFAAEKRMKEETLSSQTLKKTKKKENKQMDKDKYIVKITHCQEMNYSNSEPLQYSRVYNYLVDKRCSSGFINEWKNNVRSIPHDLAIKLKYNKKYLNQKKNHFNICLNESNGALFFEDKNYTGDCEKNNSISLQYDGDNYFFYSDKKVSYARKDNDQSIKIVQKQKIENQKATDQKEFKPKKTNEDNEAPVIDIAEVITVNDTDYEFQGKVTDQAKTIYVEVDGRPTEVKDGTFIVKGYSPIDKQISIEAIDQWGNRSKPKIVKLMIDINDISIAEKLEPLNPSKIKTKPSNDKVALIIGIEKYLESPSAKYANLDAKYFFDYARKGFGIKKQNINLLVDEEATFVKTNKALTKWLRGKIKADQSDLIIFFAGHGLASADGKELYLLPQDSDPDLLSRTALSRTELFEEIINLNPRSVTMFLDTCYSGVSRDEKMLLASARPIRIVADDNDSIPNNFTIFTASKLNQISSGIKEANHGIFSYYLMKGLEGNADLNKDRNITNSELLAYMDENVSQKASELGRKQNPTLSGDPDKVLMTY